MKIYKILYKLDNLQNVRIWYMEQNGDKYRTISGLLNGEKTISDWSTAEPKNIGKKNATTAIEQATAEIDAKYKKQLKTGYHENENDADRGTVYVEPMLAKPLKDLSKKPDFQKEIWGMQCKFNGNRCIATKNGLFTRKGERYMSVPHIENALKPFFEKHPNAVLDGELFNNELRQQLNEISKLIRKTKHIQADDLEKSEKLVKYYIYDGYGFNSATYDFGADTPYSVRKAFIDGNVIHLSDYFVEVITHIVQSEEHMNGLFQSLLSDQQEGGMLRKLDAPYEHKRSKNLIKVKMTEDSEGLITKIIEGDGNASGLAAKATIVWGGPDGKTEFDATFMGTVETRQEILKNPKNWEGKTVTFLYEGLTGKIPRKPNYGRINPYNCFSVDK